LLVNLAVTAGLVAVLMLATFGYAMRTRVHAIMDTIWPLGFVLIAGVSFLLSAGSGVAGRRVLMLVVTTVWGLRLGAHIYTRNRGQGEDKRYASLLRRNQGSLAAFVLRYIYWMQGRVGFEAVGDAQLRRFRADPANAGWVLDRGLWRYTRHPNYFGDAVVWFGLWLLACSHWLGLVLVASPVYMTNMLVRHTGKRLLEKHMARSKGRRTPSTFGAPVASSPARRVERMGRWSSGYSEVTGGTNQRSARDVTRCRACRPTSGKKPTTKATASSARSVTAVAPPSTWCSTVTMSRTSMMRYTAVA